MAKRNRQLETLELFLTFLSSLYPHDHFAPGITLAQLPNGLIKPRLRSQTTNLEKDWAKTPTSLLSFPCFYGSVKRYNGPIVTQPEVLGHPVTAGSIPEVLTKLISQWTQSNSAAFAFHQQVAKKPKKFPVKKRRS